MDRDTANTLANKLIQETTTLLENEYGSVLDERARETIDSLLQSAYETRIRKGADYADPSNTNDEVSSFKDYGKDLGISPLVAWGALYAKHQSAIWRFIRHEGRLESEPIIERLKDSLNYVLLLAALCSDLGLLGNSQEAPEKA